MPRHHHLKYAQPGLEMPRPKRTPGRWILLIAVWAVGLVIWGLYLLLIAALAFRLLTPGEP